MSSATTSKKKTSRGRQRIEIKQLEKQSTKEVTFSKRRAGLFKKAGELCILCGAEVGIIVFSPAGKPYCFGHPNIETMLNRYMNNNTSCEPAKINLPVQEYNQAYERSVEELKEEKKRGVKVNDEAMKRTNNNDMQWLNENIDNIAADEIHDYFTALQELRKKVWARYESLRIDNSAMMFSNHFGQVGFGYQYPQFGNVPYGGGAGDFNGIGGDFNGAGPSFSNGAGPSFFNGAGPFGSAGHGVFQG